MSGLRRGGFWCCGTGCVVTLRKARSKLTLAESLFIPLYSQSGQL